MGLFEADEDDHPEDGNAGGGCRGAHFATGFCDNRGRGVVRCCGVGGNLGGGGRVDGSCVLVGGQRGGGFELNVADLDKYWACLASSVQCFSGSLALARAQISRDIPCAWICNSGPKGGS